MHLRSGTYLFLNYSAACRLQQDVSIKFVVGKKIKARSSGASRSVIVLSPGRLSRRFTRSRRYLAFQKCPSVQQPTSMGRPPPGRWVDAGAERPFPSPCRCRYISLSPPSEESSNYSVGPNGQAGGRAGRGRSRPARRLAPTNDRPHPPRIIFPLLPSSRFPFAAAAAPSLVSLSQNERERRTPSWGSLNHSERASSSL